MNDIISNVIAGVAGGLIVLLVVAFFKLTSPFLNRFVSPIKFDVTARQKILPLPVFEQRLNITSSAGGFDIEFRIEPVTRFKWLYRNTHALVKVNYFDRNNIMSVLSYESGRLEEGYYRIGKYPLDIYNAQRVSISIGRWNVKPVKDHEIFIVIYNDGNSCEVPIRLSVDQIIHKDSEV